MHSQRSMGYRIRIVDDKSWRKDCARIPEDHLRQILRKIRGLEDDSWAGNVQVRQLKNCALADFRLRVGDYRVLFDKDEERKIIDLLRVLHRSKLY